MYNSLMMNEKGTCMIRTMVGFFLLFGSVGGMDTASDSDLAILVLTSFIGLALMYFGMRSVEDKGYGRSK